MLKVLIKKCKILIDSKQPMFLFSILGIGAGPSELGKFVCIIETQWTVEKVETYKKHFKDK